MQAIRLGEWWEHKLAPMAGTGYATAWVAHTSLGDAWPAIALAILAIAVCASYVSVLNDLTDLESDRAAGKPNRLEGRPRGQGVALVCACAAAGAAAAGIGWHDDPGALALYGVSWLAFSLYSIPPIRLKGRGALGAVADGVGASLAPALLAVVLVFHGADRGVAATWVVLVGVWAAATGLRGAIWHQLRDAPADERSGLRTFGRVDRWRARRVAIAAVFPIEGLAFVALLVYAGNWAAVALIPALLWLDRARFRLWDVRTVVVAPVANYRVALHEFYVVLYPLSFVAVLATRDATWLLVGLAHVALFPRTAGRLAIDTGRAAAFLVPEWLSARR